MIKEANNLIPMLSITGKPTKEEICRSLDSFYDVGINAILLYPRDGLEIEYMSEEWFITIGHFITHCETKNMKVWLYDEFNWPSGSCKNNVQKYSPKFWQKCLRLGEFDTSSQDNIYNPDGNMLEIISKCSNVDLLNPDAVDKFIELTHERYYKYFGKYFGSVIVGIFTDEPSYIYTSNVFENSIPYYDGMEDDYKKICGRDMFEDAKKANSNRPSEFIKITNDLAGKRFRNAFLTKISKWCKAHNIEFTGHLLGEEHIEYNGNTLKDLKIFSLPGMDDIYTLYDKEILQTYGLIQYAAKQCKQSMAELFALGPCNMTYDKMKRTIWQAATFGVTHYFLAIAHMNLGGNYKKCYWFNAFYDIQPNFEAMKLLCDTAAMAVKYAKKSHKYEVAVRYPREKALINSKENFEVFIDSLMTLSNMQVQWHIIDEDDICQDQFILSFDDGMVEEKTQAVIDNLTDWVKNNIHPKIYVVENGCLASELIVRIYEDEDAVIINSAEEERKLTVVCGTEKTEIVLPVDGVFVLREHISTDYEKVDFDEEFSFAQKSPGFYRAALSESHMVDTVYVEQDIYVNVLVRTYKEPCVIKLDDKIIEASMPCDMLHNSLAQHYRCSAKLKLCAGEHKIELLNEVAEKRYLPVCWIYGDFATKDNCIIAKGSSDYYLGEGDYSVDTNIPSAENVTLAFKTNNVFSKVYINEEHIGDAVFTPQTVKIPEKYIGKSVRLTIKQYTSIAPLFGDVAKLEKMLNLDTVGSGLIINSTPEECGIKETKWLISK